MRRVVVIGLALGVSACGNWPPQVGGGMAEHASPRPAAEIMETSTARRLDCSLRRMAALTQAAQAAGRETGQIMVLETSINRARREVAGRLLSDADRTLAQVDRRANELGIARPGDARMMEPCIA